MKTKLAPNAAGAGDIIPSRWAERFSRYDWPISTLKNTIPGVVLAIRSAGKWQGAGTCMNVRTR